MKNGDEFVCVDVKSRDLLTNSTTRKGKITAGQISCVEKIKVTHDDDERTDCLTCEPWKA